MVNAKDLLLLFDRPTESVALLKGGKKKKMISVPPEYLNEKYQPFASQIVSRFGESAEEEVVVNQISIPPLGDILELKRDQAFSLFIPKHQRLAGKLIDIFLGLRTKDDLMAVAVYARERVNPYLFIYAFSVALLHREDTKHLNIPSIVSSFPEKFVQNQVIGVARQEVSVVPENLQQLRNPVEIPKDYTASDLEEEHRLAYFREDIGVNLHHWHWHLVYPTTGAPEVVNKNRRGELFYYMHQQIIARYNTERLCHKLKRVERLIDWDSPLKEAYFPKLDRIVTGRSYPARVANQRMQNLRREIDNSFVDVDDMKRWRDLIYGAINSGRVKDRNNRDVELDEFGGIDILGNMVEATDLSINRQLYGNLHNMGHNIIAFIHDPDGRNLEENAVLGDVATAMRDPIFYRWHAFIDDLFHRFKATLPRYAENQLNYPGIQVQDIQVRTQGRDANVLSTFWQQSDVNISHGLDFQTRGNVFVRFTHLQHAEFEYRITVNNGSGENRRGTCRIFMAPKVDERGNPWLFRDQKNMFIELDKFTVNLQQGRNDIIRSSTQSSVTIPFERTYRDLSNIADEEQDQSSFCGCGWPHNLLIPIGTAEGYACQLFVMISNYADDRVDQSTEGICNDADSYCGIKDRLYPDRRSMGYPFDRQPRDGVDTLAQFLTPNMRVRDVTVRFENKTFRRTQ
ncbi:unnamed protein product [Phaedon cochleariae]|uniref:Tyrosinase copper-binding domain-containing protein n=1 Tax=Phaedon cochleariae TaxID=80249 RepID=A0A9N9SQ90_PHACE|nr:unnamed protein product [Phaedon cochleariae]